MDPSSETFDIVRMTRRVEAKGKRRRGARVVLGVALIAAGAARGKWLGAALALCGLHVSLKAATGRSALAHLKDFRDWTERELGRISSPGYRLDKVDQASWESFPASDPPG